ncbi:MAG: proton-conducting transporter membrane subunit [Bacilli bacterium]
MLALFNVVYIGLVTMAQRDLKMMVSYSSVAHMGLCFFGIASMSVLALAARFAYVRARSKRGAAVHAVKCRSQSCRMEYAEDGGLYRQTLLAGFFIAATLASLGLLGIRELLGRAFNSYEPVVF